MTGYLLQAPPKEKKNKKIRGSNVLILIIRCMEKWEKWKN